MSGRKPDEAHVHADEVLEGLEDETVEIFDAASVEMREVLDRRLEGYAEGVETGDDGWRGMQAVFAIGVAAECSRIAQRATEESAELVGPALRDVCAESVNVTAYQIEAQTGRPLYPCLIDQDTVDVLMERNSLLFHEAKPNSANVRAWNDRKLTSAVTQGIMNGEPIPKIAERMEAVYGSDVAAAIRMARTAVTGAENAGRMIGFGRAMDMGIGIKKRWIATLDIHTRDSHRRVDGEVVDVKEQFGNGLMFPGDPDGLPGEVYNCFVGETNAVPLGGIERSYGRFYDGDAVTVRTSHGVEFTCTPNHPILTSDGWVRAGGLHEGQDLVIARIGDDLAPGADPDVEHVGTRMDAIHELAAELASERACGLEVYFHEDVPARDVDVVTQERALRVNIETMRLEQGGEGILELADTPAPGHGPGMELGSAPAASPYGIVGGAGELGAFGWGGVRHALEHGLGAVPGRDSSVPQPERYDTSADAKLVCESLDGLSAVVCLDDVTSVEVFPVSCHVYNLQTESGVYLVSGTDNGNLYAMSHNCRCTMEGVVDEDEREGARRSKLGSLSYEDWKEGKNEGAIDIWELME